MANENQIFSLLKDLIEQSSVERAAQTKAFQASLDALRKDMRIFNFLWLMGLMALGGINVYANAKTKTFALTHSPSTTTPPQEEPSETQP